MHPIMFFLGIELQTFRSIKMKQSRKARCVASFWMVKSRNTCSSTEKNALLGLLGLPGAVLHDFMLFEFLRSLLHWANTIRSKIKGSFRKDIPEMASFPDQNELKPFPVQQKGKNVSCFLQRKMKPDFVFDARKKI